MKHVRLLIVCALMLLFSGQGAAAEQQETIDQCLEKLAGTWYDEEGRAVLTIEGGMINRCAVVGADGLAGSSVHGGMGFVVQEGTGTRTLRIGWRLFGGAGDYITVANGDALQRTLNPVYFESIGGIHFGMRTRAVREMLGEGQVLSIENPYRIGHMRFSNGWYYPEKRFIVLHAHGIVTGLTLLPGSQMRFDRSGLAVDDGWEEYARAYDLPPRPERSEEWTVYPIAPGEYLFFGQQERFVMLSIYPH